LVKRIVNEVALPAGGFYTVEIREGRERVGFKIITLDDQEAVLAHVDFKTPARAPHKTEAIVFAAYCRRNCPASSCNSNRWCRCMLCWPSLAIKA
jgi:nucleoside-triphosphatase THEP1